MTGWQREIAREERRKREAASVDAWARAVNERVESAERAAQAAQAGTERAARTVRVLAVVVVVAAAVSVVAGFVS